jgi:hypothetical protein
MVLGGVIIAAIASIAAVPAATPNPACSPSVVHFIAEPKPLSAKLMPTDWPVLERLESPYAEEAEAPQPAVIQQAMNAAPTPEPEEDTPSRRPRGHHRHHRR